MNVYYCILTILKYKKINFTWADMYVNTNTYIF